MSISYRPLNITLSADKESVLVWGQEFTTKYFTEVVIVSLLNGAGDNQSVTNKILNDVYAAGLNAGDYGIYSRHWAAHMQSIREDLERRRREAEEHQERIAAIHASPKEIAEYRQAQELKRLELRNKFGKQGAAFGQL